MPPPFPKDRQDHLLPGRSCLFFAKALTGKAARNGTGTGSASGKQTGMRGVFAPFPASPKAPTAEPIPSGNGGKTPSSCSTPALFRPHHEPRRAGAGPPRFMVRAEESGCAARRRRFAAVPARDGLGGRRFGGSRERCEDAAHSGLFPGGAARARAIAGRLSREGFCKKQTGSPRQEVILSVFWERGRHACLPP